MATPNHRKSTVDEIRRRFDGDVERFSHLESGQSATIDAPLVMNLVAAAAVASTSPIRKVLDVGCGAGNYTLKLLSVAGVDFDVDLLDLSRPMLDRAAERVGASSHGAIRTFAEDFRTAELEENAYDVVLAAAVLHHLRDDSDWEAAFAKLYRVVAPGGGVWISDLVTHDAAKVQDVMWARYGAYLSALGGEEYRDRVFAYIEREDSPRSVGYQLDLLRRVGFSQVELLHKNSCFAAFGAVKGVKQEVVGR